MDGPKYYDHNWNEIETPDESQEIEYKPVVHGHWIPHYDDGGGEYGADCSVCGVWSVLLDSADYYCPYCGARMDEDGKNS